MLYSPLEEKGQSLSESISTVFVEQPLALPGSVKNLAGLLSHFLTLGNYPIKHCVGKYPFDDCEK